MTSNSGDFEKYNINHSETQTDQAFSNYLEQLPAFEARPEFQAQLRLRLANIASIQNSKITKPAKKLTLFNKPRWLPVVLAASFAMLVFGITLIFATNVSETQVASAFEHVYDPESNAYVSSKQAAQTLGFEVNAPSYLPQSHSEYNVESSLAPAIFTNTTTTSSSSDTPTRTLQVSLVPKDATQHKPEFEIYEMRVPFSLNNPDQSTAQQPTVIRAQKFQTLKIQGGTGYLIQGETWRLVFQTKGPFQNQRPNFTRKGGVIVPVKNTPLPEASLPKGKPVPFVIGRASSAENTNQHYFLEFVPGQKWGPNAKTTLWQRNGVLFMLVSDQNTTDPELQRIAESFQAVKMQAKNK